MSWLPGSGYNGGARNKIDEWSMGVPPRPIEETACNRLIDTLLDGSLAHSREGPRGPGQ